MPEFKICILFIICMLCSLLMVEAQGPDPWDGEHNAAKISNNKKTVEIVDSVNSLSDTFYKRILQLLINRGRFKVIIIFFNYAKLLWNYVWCIFLPWFQPVSNEILNGYLHFEFSTNEFDLLRKYSSLTVPLKPKELREIDGLLADSLIFPSIVQIYAENFIDFFVDFMKKYSVCHVVIWSFSIYQFYAWLDHFFPFVKDAFDFCSCICYYYLPFSLCGLDTGIFNSIVINYVPLLVYIVGN